MTGYLGMWNQPVRASREGCPPHLHLAPSTAPSSLQSTLVRRHAIVPTCVHNERSRCTRRLLVGCGKCPRLLKHNLPLQRWQQQGRGMWQTWRGLRVVLSGGKFWRMWTRGKELEKMHHPRSQVWTWLWHWFRGHGRSLS